MIILFPFIFLIFFAGCGAEKGLITENQMLKARVEDLERENAELRIKLAQLEKKSERLKEEGKNLQDIKEMAETFQWKSARDVGVSLKETSVKKNMETVQIAAEAFARDHEGYYPKDVYELSYLLPEGLSNPFLNSTNMRDVVVNGMPARTGVVGYEPGFNSEGKCISYRIYGYGNEGLLQYIIQNRR